MKFIFTLDEVVSATRIVPLIAENMGNKEEISDIVSQLLSGNVPFIEGFIRCVNMLGKYSVHDISEIISNIPLHGEVVRFIQTHTEDCVIVTGHLMCWCEKLLKKVGCRSYGSEAECADDRVYRIQSILYKEQIVEQYKALGETVVFIGGSNDDAEAMNHADIGIATGLVCEPAQSLLSVCDYVIYDEHALCRQLCQLCGEYQTSKSVVICCAGIGSRLGLGKTKALVRINGSSLLSWQLKLFASITDVRIVIGYQGREIIEEALKYRNDVVFCYNHRYFETKTGASYYLGARHANPETIQWDGDLMVHPEDVQKILATPGEFVCYGDISSEDAVYAIVNEKGEVTAFSRTDGDFEWTGPASIEKRHLSYSSQHVYNMLEPYCPIKGIKVRAYDIDTYNDYVRVLEITKYWEL